MTFINIDLLPPEILQSHRAVLWNHEVRDGKPTKVPYTPHRPADRASVSDPSTWGVFAEAITAQEDGKADGLGIVLGDGLVGIDLDKCRDPQTGAIDAEALAIIREIDSYTEVSPSGSGVHILLHGALPSGGRRTGKIEIYADGRYFTVTGHHVTGTPQTIEKRSTQLAELHARIFPKNGNGNGQPAPRAASVVSCDDETLLARARRAKNGDTFTRLWAGDWSGHPSQSEADLALCDSLAFWTGGDAARVDSLFRQSGLMREKWDKRHGAATYGETTVAKAVADCEDVYAGPTKAPGADRQTASTPTDSQVTSGGGMIAENLTDVGNARRLVALHGRDFRWCEVWKGFWIWDGVRWTRDDCGQVPRMAKATARAMYAEAADTGDEAQRKALGSHALRSESESRLRGMIGLAKSEQGIPVTPDAFDRDPWLLNCENGTLDLRTGQLREHRREDLITKLVPVAYDPQAGAGPWLAFLDRVMGHDTAMIEFLQMAAGYSLTGSIQEQL